MSNRTPPPCSNCGHAYGDHTGRALMAGGGIGPADRFEWGTGCAARMGLHHTCACPKWLTYVPDGEDAMEVQRWVERHEED